MILRTISGFDMPALFGEVWLSVNFESVGEKAPKIRPSVCTRAKLNFLRAISGREGMNGGENLRSARSDRIRNILWFVPKDLRKRELEIR